MSIITGKLGSSIDGKYYLLSMKYHKKSSLRQITRSIIKAHLLYNKFNVSKTAKQLGISRQTVYNYFPNGDINS